MFFWIVSGVLLAAVDIFCGRGHIKIEGFPQQAGRTDGVGMSGGRYAERQEDELLFLREVFRSDLEDLREKDPWKMNRAPEIQLRIVPDKSRGSDVRQKLYVLLRAKYPTNYPDDVPALSVEEYKGISESSQERLLAELARLAEDCVGEVMMFQLVQHTQQFLDHNDQTMLPSLYEQMVQREQRREDERKRQSEREQETQQERIEKEIEEAFKQHAEQRRKGSGMSKQSEADGGKLSSSPALMRLTPGGSPVLARHKLGGSPGSRGSPTLPRNLTPRKREDGAGPTVANLHRGKLIGTSSYGYSVYVGLDSSGELVALYEWVLHCRPAKRGHADLGLAAARRVKQVQSVRQELQGLKHLGHRNLARYMDLTYDVDQDNITVQLCMEYVAGANLNKLLLEGEHPFYGEKLRNITFQLLEALTHLHSQGIVHKDLRLSLVFIDAAEVVKLTGYAILKRLTDLHKAVQQQRVQNGVEDGVGGAAAEQVGGKRGDIVKLGLLVLSLATGEPLTLQPTRLPSDLPELLRDFISKCLDVDRYRILSARDLLTHTFVATPLKQGGTRMEMGGVRRVSKTGVPIPASPQRQQDAFTLLSSPVVSQAQFAPQKSRLKSEFEELEYLGRGGFGDVLKVRNYLDSRIYAIKRVQLPLDSKGMKRKIIREVKLLSQMNHENVVRYFNAWIETQPGDAFSSTSILEEEDEDVGGSSSGRGPNSDGGSNGPGNSDSDSDSDSSGDSYISFTVSEVSEVNDTSDSVVMFENNSESTLSSPVEEGKEMGEGEGEGEGEEVFSMSPTNYAVDTKTILAQIDRAKDYSDRSDPVIWHRSQSSESFEELPRRLSGSHSHMQISYLYIQMEFCENRTLRHLIDDSRLHREDDMLWRLLREITEGLNHIHKQGMIHRDLKPGNIFLDKNGYVKIGDFGLATTLGFTRKTSVIPPPEVSMLEHLGRQELSSGPVGTFFYTSPEMLDPILQRKVTQKVDMYSLGVIFFEMCHPPPSTEMERQQLLTALRKDQPELPTLFSEYKMKKKSDVIRWLLDHNPHRRPTAEALLQSEYIPPKMEDKELLEVLTRTLSSTNSTSYQRLMAELFCQSVPIAKGFAYFYDLQEQKHSLIHALVHQEIKDKIQSVFEKHNAVLLATPLLMPKWLHKDGDQAATLMDNTGGLVNLPSDLRVPLAKYVAMHDITDLRRFTIDRVFRESGAQKVNFVHPRETVECAFDIVTDDPCSLLPDAECVCVVAEIINEFPPLKSLNYSVHINHVLLLKAVMEYCSVPAETQKDLLRIPHQLSIGVTSVEDLLSSVLRISKLAASQLARFIGTALPINEARMLLEPLLKDRGPAGTMASQGWHEVELVDSHLRSFGCKEQVLLNLGMVQNVHLYCGVFFQVQRSTGVLASVKKKYRRLILAAGGRYDRLISTFQVPSRQQTGRPIRGVGVSISEDHIYSTIVRAQGTPTPVESIKRSAVLVHWLGVEQLTEDCVTLTKSLWQKGIPAQLYYTTADTLSELQGYCHRNFIPHLVILVDRQYKERNQLKVYSMEGGRVVADKVIPARDISDYLLQKIRGYSRNMESPDAALLMPKPHHPSSTTELSAPQVSFSVISLQKLPGQVKRKIQDQAYAKVVHIVRRMNCPMEVLSVDMDGDSLSQLVLHLNRQPELKDDLSDIVKQVCEKSHKVNKKLLVKLCEEIHQLLTDSKCPVVILDSLTADQVQVITNIW